MQRLKACSHKPRNASKHHKAGAGGDPWSLQSKYPVGTLISAFRPPHCKRIHFCCFKPSKFAVICCGSPKERMQCQLKERKPFVRRSPSAGPQGPPCALVCSFLLASSSLRLVPHRPLTFLEDPLLSREPTRQHPGAPDSGFPVPRQKAGLTTILRGCLCLHPLPSSVASSRTPPRAPANSAPAQRGTS